MKTSTIPRGRPIFPSMALSSFAMLSALVCAACTERQNSADVKAEPEEKNLIAKFLDNLKPVASELPPDFEKGSACEKREHLWKKIEDSRHAKPVQFRSIDLSALFVNFLRLKISHISDQAPQGYKKGLHAVGTVAKVRYSSTNSHRLTGFFQDDDVCGFLRLSLTSKPGDIAPGLALKLFANGRASANVSALVSLDGQEQNHNFFAHDMTNIVGPSRKISGIASSHLFNTVTKHARKLSVARFAAYNSEGVTATQPLYPYQVYFVPPKAVRGLFTSAKHDVLDDLRSLKVSDFNKDQGHVIYELWAVVPNDNSRATLKEHVAEIDSDAKRYKEKAEKIGEISLESDMTSSAYGDDQLFFLHDRFENE